MVWTRLKRATEALFKAPDAPVDTTFNQHQWVRLAASGIGASRILRPYEQMSWVYTGVRAIARPLSAIPFGIYRLEDESPGKKFGERKRKVLGRQKSILSSSRRLTARSMKDLGLVPVDGSPVMHLLEYPGGGMTTKEMVDGLVSWLCLCGEMVFLREPWTAPPTVLPEAIRVVSPSTLTPQVEADGHISAWQWKRRVGHTWVEDTVPVEAVGFVRLFNPYNPIRGMSPLQAALLGMKQDYAASGFNLAFYENYAEPGVMLEHPETLDPEEKSEILRAWEERHAGFTRRSKTVLLDGGLKANPFPVNHQSMQFLDLRKFSKAEILATLGVPQHCVDEDDANFATAMASKRRLWENAVIPVARLMEDLINDNLVTPYTGGDQFFAFDMSMVEALQEDFGVKLQHAEKLYMLGWTPNDINRRLELGMEDLKWGNTVLVQYGRLPIEQVVNATNEDDADGAGSDLQMPPGAVRATDVPAPAPSFLSDKRQEQAVYWENYIRTYWTPIEQVTQRRVKAWLYQLRVDTLRRFDDVANGQLSAIPKSSDPENMIYRQAEAQGQLRATFKPLYSDMAQAAASSMAADTGIAVTDFLTPRVTSFIAVKLNKVVGIEERLRAVLVDSLREGLAQGESYAELRTRIKAVFNNAVQPSRTLRIARTETGQTVSGVRHEIMAEHNMEQEWVTAGDENVREDHVTLGTTGPKPLDYNYMQDLGKPGVLNYPLDVNGPADQVISCRCAAKPVIPKE